jgi:serine/threonine protein kinase
VATKLLHVENESEATATRILINEAKTLVHLAHPNVIQLLGVCIDPVTCVSSQSTPNDAVLETSLNLTLMSAIAGADYTGASGAGKNILTLPVYRRLLLFLNGIVRAMHRLHSMQPPVFHCDLKTGNILITKDWECKVADFGMVTGLATIKTVALAYEAPEVLDVYSYTS